MANRSYLNYADELADDDKPYDSISDRQPLEDVSLAGQVSASAQDQDEMQDDAGLPQVPSVKDYIAQKMAGGGNPIPPPPTMPGQSGPSSYLNDPLMQDYQKKEADLGDFRQAKIQSDLISNIGRAASVAAQGANAPVPGGGGLFNALDSQSAELLKSREGDLSRRQKIVDAIEARKSREEIAKGRMQTSTENAKMRAAILGQSAQARQDAKDEVQNNKWATQMKDDLDPNKARGGNLALNQKRVDNAARIEALLSQVHNNPDPRQMEELAISAQALLSASGTPAAEQVKALIPKTALGDVNKFKEWLSNDPTGTGQQAFVARMAETVQREKEVASNQVEKAQRQRLSAYDKFRKADPDSYNLILNGYGLGPNDKKAMGAADEKAASFPKQVMKAGKIATVSNQKELDEAAQEGWN